MENDAKFANFSHSKSSNANDKIEQVPEVTEDSNEVIYRDDDDGQDVGCLSSCCHWFSKKGILRKNTLKLAHRLRKRRSRKSFTDIEIVVEEKGDLSEKTLAALAGR
jgi:hypothetical protein